MLIFVTMNDSLVDSLNVCVCFLSSFTVTSITSLCLYFIQYLSYTMVGRRPSLILHRFKICTQEFILESSVMAL